MGAVAVPFFTLASLGFTPLGEWFLRTVYGVDQSLLQTSIHTLRAFCLYTLLYPCIDYCNGLLMQKRQTKYMAFSQAANVTTTVLALIAMVWLAPGWNGVIGALGQCLGQAGELGVVAWVVYRLARPSFRSRDGNFLRLRND
jgi:O-antigen/teichoic acid export membrane protein